MKPTTKTENAAWIAKRRANHHAALETLRAPGVTTPGLTLWRKLRTIEKGAERVILHYCNGTGGVNTENIDAKLEPFRDQVRSLFGKTPKGFFINTDPRGYALKLDPEKCTVPEGMGTDWGRYGLLADEITEG